MNKCNLNATKIYACINHVKVSYKQGDTNKRELHTQNCFALQKSSQKKYASYVICRRGEGCYMNCRLHYSLLA